MCALAAVPRAGRLLRWAGTLESSAFAASRGFVSTTGAGESDGGLGEASSIPSSAAATASAADDASSLSAAAADGMTAAAATAAAQSSSEFGVVLGSAIAAVDGLHAATGLPWWATISAVGVAVRAAMLPVSLQGMKASAALMPLLRQAREEVAAGMRPLPSAPAPAPSRAADGPREEEHRKGGKQQRWQRAQQQAAAAAAAAPQQHQGADGGPHPQARVGPSTAQILERFHRLRLQAGAPHPIWVVASPLLQLPVFITAMAAIRTMSLNAWPGFSEGGVSWFTDLTLPAMDLATWTAPMGTVGVVLPAAIVLSMLANIDAAFSVPAGSRQQASVALWLVGGLRLLMEWMMVPLFAVALQLPQGALCYWATSSGMALLQNQALKHPTVRQAVGLPTAALQPAAGATAAKQPLSEAAAAAAASVAAGAAGALPQGLDPALRQFLATTSDQAALFDRAAQLRAEGRAGATSAVLQRLLQLYPGQPNALYALGQVHAALKDWQLSEQYFLQAAHSMQLDAQLRARAWFGAAVAMHMQQEHDTALDAFKKAADAAQTDELRVRSWVSQATLHRQLGQLDAAAGLLRKAARAEPGVEEAYLKPLLVEMAGQTGAEGQHEAAQEERQVQQQEGSEKDGSRASK